MKRRFSKNVSPIPAVLTSLAISVLLTCLTVLAAGVVVLKNDVYGLWLTVILYLSVVPGCCAASVLLRKRCRMKGIVCDLIGGGVVTLLYVSVLLCFNHFSIRPTILPVILFGILISALCGILYSNLRR